MDDPSSAFLEAFNAIDTWLRKRANADARTDFHEVVDLGWALIVLGGLAAFDAFLHWGKRLEAILLTENGRPNEKPLGIVTVHDIPKIWWATQVKRS